MGDHKVDLHKIVRELVLRKVQEAITEIEMDEIVTEAEEAGLNGRQVKSRVEDGTVEEILDNLKSEVTEYLSNEEH